MIFGITANCFCRCNRPGIDGVRTFPPPLPETFVRTRRRGEKNRDIGKAVAQQFDKFVHLIIMQVDVIPPVMAFVGSEGQNQQFRLHGCNIGNTSRMGKRQTGSPVHPHIGIRDSTKGFFQQRSRSLRIDVPAYVTVSDMENTHRIFGKSGTYLTETFKYGCQQGNAVDYLIPSGFAESGRKRSLHGDGIIRPVHFPQRFYHFQGLPQWRTGRDTVLRLSCRKKKECCHQSQDKAQQQVILAHKHASCHIVPYHISMFHRAVLPDVCLPGS